MGSFTSQNPLVPTMATSTWFLGPIIPLVYLFVATPTLVILTVIRDVSHGGWGHVIAQACHFQLEFWTFCLSCLHSLFCFWPSHLLAGELSVLFLYFPLGLRLCPFSWPWPWPPPHNDSDLPSVYLLLLVALHFHPHSISLGTLLKQAGILTRPNVPRSSEGQMNISDLPCPEAYYHNILSYISEPSLHLGCAHMPHYLHSWDPEHLFKMLTWYCSYVFLTTICQLLQVSHCGLITPAVTYWIPFMYCEGSFYIPTVLDHGTQIFG